MATLVGRTEITFNLAITKFSHNNQQGNYEKEHFLRKLRAFKPLLIGWLKIKIKTAVITKSFGQLRFGIQCERTCDFFLLHIFAQSFFETINFLI